MVLEHYSRGKPADIWFLDLVFDQIYQFSGLKMGNFLKNHIFQITNMVSRPIFDVDFIFRGPRFNFSVKNRFFDVQKSNFWKNLVEFFEIDINVPNLLSPTHPIGLIF